MKTKLPDLARLNTLCTGCLHPMVFECPQEVLHEGKSITAGEYLGLILKSDKKGIFCEDCLEELYPHDAEVAAGATNPNTNTGIWLHSTDWCQWK